MIEATTSENVNRPDPPSSTAVVESTVAVGEALWRTGGLMTRVQLAEALSVSLRTVDGMVADEEITPVRLRGKLVRFYLPDVLQELREKSQTSKRRVTRAV